MLTRSPGWSQPPKYSAVTIDTTEALLAWCPPTFVLSAFGRTWLASWIMRVASHNTRCWIRSSVAKATDIGVQRNAAPSSPKRAFKHLDGRVGGEPRERGRAGIPSATEALGQG